MVQLAILRFAATKRIPMIRFRKGGNTAASNNLSTSDISGGSSTTAKSVS